MKSIYDMEFGSQLCDVHNGLSQLETRIQGFELVSHTKLSFKNASDTMNSMFLAIGLPEFQAINKILYLFGEANNATFQALYHYDGDTLGIVVFRAQ